MEGLVAQMASAVRTARLQRDRRRLEAAALQIANYRYPTDPREDLDYVLYRKGNARPAGWENNVVLEQSAPWTVSSWGTDYTYTNLSDHYPVIGR